jgi:hypothetical protein
MEFEGQNEHRHRSSGWTESSETSFSSHDGLVVDEEPPRRYNFDPICSYNSMMSVPLVEAI